METHNRRKLFDDSDEENNQNDDARTSKTLKPF